MTASSIHALFSQFNTASGCDAFDGHVLACIFAVAAAETGPGRSLVDALGISGKALRLCCEEYFPGALRALEPIGLDGEPEVNEDEKCLRELLRRSRSSAGPFSSLLAALVARRCTRPNHLWQDLGLQNRSELSMLMMRHFTPLAMRNDQDMKWKKFFYRMICRDEGFSLCSAPSCSECSDFENCFGDESGESLLARTRFLAETQGLISIAPAYSL
jgi:nitrogen fixation protein NifQ